MPVLILALFYQSTSSFLKVRGGVLVVVRWWVAHVVLVSAKVLLVLTLGLWLANISHILYLFYIFISQAFLGKNTKFLCSLNWK